MEALADETVVLEVRLRGGARLYSLRGNFIAVHANVKTDDAPELEDPLPLAAGEDAAPARPRLARLGTGPSDNLASTAGHVAVPWMSWITSNPLAGLPSLPKLHYSYPYPSCAVPPESCGNASTWPMKHGKPAPDPGNISHVTHTIISEIYLRSSNDIRNDLAGR